MSPLILLCLGAVGGVLTRHFVYELCKNSSVQFPLATLLVNLLGCLAIGFFLAWTELRGSGSSSKYLIQFGFLGAFTTFSAFGLDSFQLIRSHSYTALGLSILANVGLGILAVASTYFLGNRIFERL